MEFSSMITRILIVAMTFSLGTMPSAVARAVDGIDLTIQAVPLDANPYTSSASDTMAMNYVSSVGVDSFHWYRNNSISGDTFEIDSMTTNVSAPFQIAVEVEGSWDFDVHSATAIHVYTAGSGSAAVSVGTLTLGDGYHIIYNDTAAGGSELHIDLPGPSSSSSGSGSGSGCTSCPSPMGSPSNPLWDDIEAEFAHVEWKMVDGRLQYRFLGNNSASTLYTDLHQPSGSGDIEVSYIGDTSCSSLSMPAELVHDAVSVSSGHHYLQAGTSGSGPWSLYVSWGPEPCEADLNGDGTVDIADLMVMFSAWGGCP
jgi:hypothetical protein